MKKYSIFLPSNIRNLIKSTKKHINNTLYRIEYKNFLILISFILLLFCFNVGMKYYEFEKFLHTPFFQGKIIKSFEKTKKNGRKYQVLHIQTDNFLLYATTYENISSNHIKFKIIKNKITFYEYIKSRFYAPIYKITQLKNIEEDMFKKYILSQHKDEKMQDFYGALFFAKPISSELRNDVNYYGIAHLLAISGYHLGLIYGILFFMLKHFYRYFQQRFFPYRSIEFDLGVIIFTIISIYFLEIGFVPSFLRSFVMGILGFYLLCRGIKLVNFMHLFLAFLICVGFFPSLLFNVGFFFSCMGVFYIFLYARHFFKKTIFSIIGFEIWTFFAMILPVLYFFPLFSMQQLLAIILTPIFVVFYPLSMMLHTIYLGGVFDEYMLKFLNFKMLGDNVKISAMIFYPYIFLSFVSIFNKYLAIALVGFNVLLFIWFFIENYLLV